MVIAIILLSLSLFLSLSIHHTWNIVCYKIFYENKQFDFILSQNLLNKYISRRII